MLMENSRQEENVPQINCNCRLMQIEDTFQVNLLHLIICGGDEASLSDVVKTFLYLDGATHLL